MSYKLIFEEQARKQFRKMDNHLEKQILQWLKKNVEETENPRLHGSVLTGNLAGFWRYRIGDYRVICDICDQEVVVYIVDVGHRREIYRL